MEREWKFYISHTFYWSGLQKCTDKKVAWSLIPSICTARCIRKIYEQTISFKHWICLYLVRFCFIFTSIRYIKVFSIETVVISIWRNKQPKRTVGVKKNCRILSIPEWLRFKLAIFTYTIFHKSSSFCIPPQSIE